MNKTKGNNMNIDFTGKAIVFTGASIIKRDYLFGLCEAILYAVYPENDMVMIALTSTL